MGEKVIVPNESTLWSIAGEHLGEPKRWIDVFVKNFKTLEGRVYIMAGTELEMPGPDERYEPGPVE